MKLSTTTNTYAIMYMYVFCNASKASIDHDCDSFLTKVVPKARLCSNNNEKHTNIYGFGNKNTKGDIAHTKNSGRLYLYTSNASKASGIKIKKIPSLLDIKTLSTSKITNNIVFETYAKSFLPEANSSNVRCAIYTPTKIPK